MEENTLMTRLTQLLADLKAVRAEMGEVLTQLAAWDEEEFIEVPPLGWPHDPSLQTWIRAWLSDAVVQDGGTPSELSRTFAFGTGPVLVRAQHVLDHYWLVTNPHGRVSAGRQRRCWRGNGDGRRRRSHPPGGGRSQPVRGKTGRGTPVPVRARRVRAGRVGGNATGPPPRT